MGPTWAPTLLQVGVPGGSFGVLGGSFGVLGCSFGVLFVSSSLRAKEPLVSYRPLALSHLRDGLEPFQGTEARGEALGKSPGS